VREASEKDIDKLLIMARSFIKDLRHPLNVPVDDISLTKTIENLISSPDAVVLMTDNGAIGGLVFPYFFNASVKTGQELFWWVNEDCRGTGEGKMLHEGFSDWVGKMGATSITMACLNNENLERLSALYVDAGYMPTETNFVREI
jgi:hypothetical protein